MKTAAIIITNILPTGTTFALLADTMESVFVNASVSKFAGLQVGETVQAEIVPNHQQPDRTPWQATKIMRNAAPPVVGLEQRVTDELWVEEATAKELSEALGADESAVQVTLDRMMSQGKIRAYSVYAIVLEGKK
jgi:hypothetical protein